MNVTKRERFLLKELLNFDINRYLMANTHGRNDGHEKAEKHIAISKTLVGYITCSASSAKDPRLWRKVHDYLADVLTNKMDEVIRFPVDTPVRGAEYQEYVEKFFDFIINEMSNIEKLISIDTGSNIPTKLEYDEAKEIVLLYENVESRLLDIKLKAFEEELSELFLSNGIKKFRLDELWCGSGYDITPLDPYFDEDYSGYLDNEIEALAKKHGINASMSSECYGK
jgi:hypothetical protein